MPEDRLSGCEFADEVEGLGCGYPGLGRESLSGAGTSHGKKGNRLGKRMRGWC